MFLEDLDNHRIIEQFGLEGALKIIYLASATAKERGGVSILSESGALYFSFHTGERDACVFIYMD